MNKSLDIFEIRKSIKDKVLVNNVSISLHPGEIVGLLGPNGAGKTTCFYLIAGIEKTENGVIRLDDTDITAMNLAQRALSGLAYLPQEASIFQSLSVEDNLRVAIELIGVTDENEITKIIGTFLEQMHLTHLAKTRGTNLSGGERRRVEIARLLCTNPKYILLDEPFAGIDPISVIETQYLIAQLSSKGIGVLITDHNYRELLSICKRVYFLYEGSILVEGNETEITSHPIVKKIYLGESEFK
ncbi:MAG: LPS export ABC transporter ATP-binding protein [Methylacidiphilales bacterium]|nr:LPS export ABC transporter ATP-binding protein [Candidatus Methylacidiphilales bacterium]